MVNRYGWQSILCLILLTVQSSTLILFMRHTLRSRDTITTTSGSSSPPSYISGSLVVSVEAMKLLVGWVAEIITSPPGQRNPLVIFYRLGYDIRHNGRIVVRLAIPAALYALQNNLTYFALRRLTTVSFQVAQQLKILTTALFAVGILRRRLRGQQWLALIVLMGGVAIVQLATVQQAVISDRERGSRDSWLGFLAMALVSLSSGFAGIYFERLIKASQPTAPIVPSFRRTISRLKLNNVNKKTDIKKLDKNADFHRSLWLQSIELGIFGLLFSIIIVISSQDTLKEVLTRGFFVGYGNPVTWVIILMQAVGGMLVALVVRYADSILKAFSTSASIVLSALFSWLIWGEKEVGGDGWSGRAGTSGGAMLVGVALYLYATATSISSNGGTIEMAKNNNQLTSNHDKRL